MESILPNRKAYPYKLDTSVKTRGLLFTVEKCVFREPLEKNPMGSRLYPKSAWGIEVKNFLWFIQIFD
tara:strand:+ start:746 stop:949 length:204 start_codon:yes stop_codon:yes gene_type:complete